MKKIFVGVPHSIDVIDGAEFSPAIRKYVGGEIVSSIPSNGILNASFETTLVSNEDGIPTYDNKVTGCDPYPQGYDIVVVSGRYASAYRKLHGGDVPPSMRVVADPVMTADGKTFRGCRGLALPF